MNNPVSGSRTIRSYTPRDIYYTKELKPGMDGGRIDSTYAIDGGNTGFTDELRPGTLMGRITANGQWVACKRTQVNAAGATAASFAVDDARAFMAGDTITVGGDTGLTILSINYGTNTITLTGSITFADNDAVFASGALAGSETARGVLDEFVQLYDPNTKALRDLYVGRIITSNAKIRTDMILGDLAACRASGVTNFLNHLQFYTNGVQV